MSSLVQHPAKPPAPWWVQYSTSLMFVDGGRQSPHVDCFGFVRLAYFEQLNITLPEWPQLKLDDVAASDTNLFENRFSSGFNAIEMGLEQGFDMAVIRRPLPVNGKTKLGWWHLGIVTRAGCLVHMHNAQGIIEEQFRDTPEARASSTLTARDVRIFRYATLNISTARLERCA